MPHRPLVQKWTDEEIRRLIELLDSGATLMRACSALRRTQSAIQKMARKQGRSFPSVRRVRAELRASGAIERPPK
jgi:hypothetical protein